MRMVVISGANRGIGLALSRAFAAVGDKVIGGVRDPSAAGELSRITGAGPVRVLRLDVTDAGAVSAFADELGGQVVDVLINNAGVIGGERQSLGNIDYDAWREAFEVNTLAPYRLIAALLPNLLASATPKVITLTSQMGSLTRARGGSVAYRSTKAAANKVMQVLAEELKPRGVVVCPVHPGWVVTDMGGPGADIHVEESASGIRALVDRLDLSQSGRFWKWDGTEHPW